MILDASTKFNQICQVKTFVFDKLSHILLLWGNPEKTLVRIHVKLMCILKNLVNSTEVFFL